MLGVSAIEVISVKIAIGLLSLEHVIDDYQDYVASGDDRR